MLCLFHHDVEDFFYKILCKEISLYLSAIESIRFYVIMSGFHMYIGKLFAMVSSVICYSILI